MRTVSKGKYMYAVTPDHPRATAKGYVLEHRIVVETNIGRILERYEHVHHINGDTKDNRLENLRVVSPAEHNKLHGTGRSVVSLTCDFCGTTFDRFANQRPEVKGYTRAFCTKSCRAKARGRIPSAF